MGAVGPLHDEERERSPEMQSMVDTIGENAGQVWDVISRNGPLSVAAITKQTKLKAAEANQAIGWLAREDKLIFEGKGSKVKIGLKG
jgi:hypothetical protein